MGINDSHAPCPETEHPTSFEYFQIALTELVSGIE